jgi:hypothetical protein
MAAMLLSSETIAILLLIINNQISYKYGQFQNSISFETNHRSLNLTVIAVVLIHLQHTYFLIYENLTQNGNIYVLSFNRF